MAIKMNGDCQFKLIWIHFNIVTVSWYWTIIWVTFDCIQLLMIYLYLVYRWMRGLCNICSCLIDVVSFCFWSFSIMYRIKFINLCHEIIQCKKKYLNMGFDLAMKMTIIRMLLLIYQCNSIHVSYITFKDGKICLPSFIIHMNGIISKRENCTIKCDFLSLKMDFQWLVFVFPLICPRQIQCQRKLNFYAKVLH